MARWAAGSGCWDPQASVHEITQLASLRYCIWGRYRVGQTVLFTWILNKFLRVARLNTKKKFQDSHFLNSQLKMYLKTFLVNDPQNAGNINQLSW